ncbi:hypothetical protein PROFUN_01858 [Planoprotostelium fungivorum]|uniref:Uncharacterized protein n=1 Tax=Planoprotostelium fungivorum TaxID=1890364 RepID=A0A2P6NYY7_9EUKA|nr:hypothetical protein PROFUN_01858 [Planoprotostelium fungivorum]
MVRATNGRRARDYPVDSTPILTAKDAPSQKQLRSNNTAMDNHPVFWRDRQQPEGHPLNLAVKVYCLPPEVMLQAWYLVTLDKKTWMKRLNTKPIDGDAPLLMHWRPLFFSTCVSFGSTLDFINSHFPGTNLTKVKIDALPFSIHEFRRRFVEPLVSLDRHRFLSYATCGFNWSSSSPKDPPNTPPWQSSGFSLDMSHPDRWESYRRWFETHLGILNQMQDSADQMRSDALEKATPLRTHIHSSISSMMLRIGQRNRLDHIATSMTRSSPSGFIHRTWRHSDTVVRTLDDLLLLTREKEWQIIPKMHEGRPCVIRFALEGINKRRGPDSNAPIFQNVEQLKATACYDLDQLF